MGAFGALKVLSTVNPATLCSSNRMEIIPQSDFNILTKIMRRNAKYMDLHFGGKTRRFAAHGDSLGMGIRGLRMHIPGDRGDILIQI